eukprot:1267354-Rhodomonas_salina.2
MAERTCRGRASSEPGTRLRVSSRHGVAVCVCVCLRESVCVCVSTWRRVWKVWGSTCTMAASSGSAIRNVSTGHRLADA